MKSMLHEASTIVKAIQKAWLESGKPEEFTIKVLEAGEKGILWFGGRPAIVSITFDPKSSSAKRTLGSQDARRNNSQSTQRGRSGQKPMQDNLGTPKPQVRGDHGSTNRSRTENNRHSEGQRPQNRTSQGAQFSQRSSSDTGLQPMHELRKLNHEDVQTWTPELVQDVAALLRETCKIANIAPSFDPKADGKSLTLTFDAPLSSSREDERSLFVSLSYLLVQALKKKHKKKFKGFHLVLTAKQSGSDGNTRTDSAA